MRIIVPLQGIVRGRGGLVLGSLIPCALFYFLQLYLKRRHQRSLSPSRLPPIRRAPSSRSLHSYAPAPISARGTSIAASPDSSYYSGIRASLADPYHPDSNPDGVIQLGLAENHLSLDLLQDWLADNLQSAVLGARPGELSISGLATYQPFDGLMDLKIAVAGFMGQVMQASVSVDPSQIVLTSGATPAIETLSFCLADPGNGFLVPSPYYPGFDRDIKLRTGIQLLSVPCRSADNFSLSVAALERAYNQAKKRGIKVSAILLTNPSNPVGNVLNPDTLHDVLYFATQKNIHVISDEVYAGSVYGNDRFVSIIELLDREDFDKSRVHLVYGLSKDLSLPGFRVGVIYSYNENVLAAAKKMARFSSISVPTQRLLVSMLSDRNFITQFMEMNRKRLLKMYTLFANGLKQLGIACADSSGGFYCWADMSKFIRPYNEKGELELWDRLLSIAKINVTPGSSCHCIEPGWFRCCFATLTEKDIPVVMERIRKVTELPKGRH